MYVQSNMEDLRQSFCSCLYYSANAFSRLLTKMGDEEFAITGLATSYGFLLLTLGKQEGQNPSSIAHTMQLTPSTVTRLVEKLENKGFVRRESAGRNTQVFLTEKGEAHLPVVQKAWSNLYQRYTELLGEEWSKNMTGELFQAAQTLEEEGTSV